jgi:ParB-like chromosome segregation protein Spo0J
MSDNIHVNTEIVEITSLKPYPKNPRRGDVEEIAKSLEVNGQYKPIVVNKRDSMILAGNHTWRAARSLGWTHIAVSFVDVDDYGAQKIVLADNRTSDMSSYDDSKLLDLLQSLPTLDGTGFNEVDIDQLQTLIDGTGEFEAPNKDRTGAVGKEIRVCVGSYRVLVDDDVYKDWAESVLSKVGEEDKVVPELKKRLRLSDVSQIAAEKARAKRQKRNIDRQQMHSVMLSTENVDINSVFPYPMNARQGDIGLIAESLSKNGQFRPIVVNKRDNSILVGNHTWKAAKALGWKQIAATFVDCDDEEAAKIVLVDNKTSDMGSYDHVELAEILQSLPAFEGTGYTGDDLDDLMHEVAGWGIKEKPVKEKNDKPRNVTSIVGKWEFKMAPNFYEDWEESIFVEFGFSYEEVCAGIMQLLEIQNDAWVSTRQRRSKKVSPRRANGE